jgi:hypothetical protein
MAEMPEPLLEDSGRNPRIHAMGAPNVAARCIIWRQWKRPHTRARNLIKRGLTEERAWNHAFPKSYFEQLGLVSLLTRYRQF